METIYNISKKELNRRLVAYTTLVISFFFSLILFSFNYIIQYINLLLYILLIMAFLLFYSRILVAKYFKSLLKTDVGLTPEYIRKNKTKYLIKNIRSIIIKRTTGGYIREIKIKLNNNVSTYINNSTDNMEEFTTELIKYLPKKVINKTIHEPLDYDHPTFYFFVGIILSFVSAQSIKFLFSLSAENMNFINYIISVLSFIFGIYFISYKPIYKRDEKDNKFADYIWGCIFIIGGLLVLISVIL